MEARLASSPCLSAASSACAPDADIPIRSSAEGRSAGGWHTALGAGAFVRAGGYTATVQYAYGDRGIVYLRLGLPF